MTYNYSFDIAGFISAIFLLICYWMRRSYRTKSNRILVALLVVDLLGCAFDVASCYSITLPGKFPMWFNNFTTLGYLYFYNTMGVLFFAYLDAKTKIRQIWKPVKKIVAGSFVFYSLLIWTSPWTHFIAYFDENMVYSHGPLMPLLYVLAAMYLLAGAILFVIMRTRFNAYQVVAITSFIVAVFLGVLIQMINPNLLVGQFACTLVLFFIYTSLENPAYYTYRGTSCYNRNAFQQTLRNKLRFGEDISFFAFAIKDYDNLRDGLSLKNNDRISSRIATAMNHKYGTKSFCITDDKFVVFIDREEEEYAVLETVESISNKPIELVDTTVNVSFKYATVLHVDNTYKMDVIESAIVNLLDHSEGFSDTEEFNIVVKQLDRQKDICRILKEAIDNENFNVVYQPIKDVHSGKFISSEALVRLSNSDIGYISPEEFIPIAESQGMIQKIGEIVFDRVCRFIKESSCIENLGVKYIEINLSPLQFFDIRLVKDYTSIMEKYGVDPSWINLEITETASFAKDDIMYLNIAKFHEMGTSFSLDDYGSGFASADYLFKLPVEIVKIDKGILWQAMKDENAKIVLLSTLKMLKELGKRIVVEGVENEEMVKLLTENGCDYMQGYYYSKPISPKEYVEFLDNNR